MGDTNGVLQNDQFLGLLGGYTTCLK